jgi:hypothetical protein
MDLNKTITAEQLKAISKRLDENKHEEKCVVMSTSFLEYLSGCIPVASVDEKDTSMHLNGHCGTLTGMRVFIDEKVCGFEIHSLKEYMEELDKK